MAYSQRLQEMAIDRSARWTAAEKFFEMVIWGVLPSS